MILEKVRSVVQSGAMASRLRLFFKVLSLPASRRTLLTARTSRRLAALLCFPLLVGGCVAGGDSSSLARIDRLETIVKGLEVHIDTISNQVFDKIEATIGGGGDSITAWIYAVGAIGLIAAALFYPVVWRPLRELRIKRKVETSMLDMGFTKKPKPRSKEKKRR